MNSRCSPSIAVVHNYGHMGCGSSKSPTDGFSHPEGPRPSRPAEFLDFVKNSDQTEQDALLEEDCKRDEARLAEAGVGALVREALMRQRARMLSMQIIMKFQEALVVRHRLARAVYQRWRFVVECRRAGVDAGTWSPPRSSRANAKAMKARQMERTDDVILDQAKDQRQSTKEEMNYLRRLKEDDLMRVIETQRQEAEARGGKMNVRKLLASYGLGAGGAGDGGRACCRGRTCVIS